MRIFRVGEGRKGEAVNVCIYRIWVEGSGGGR